MAHLQIIVPFNVPHPPSVRLLNAFAQVRINWALDVTTLLPADLQGWINWDEEDRSLLYLRPSNSEKRNAWRSEYKRAEGMVLGSLPSQFIYELGKLSNLQLGFGPPLDLYEFIQQVNTLCTSLDDDQEEDSGDAVDQEETMEVDSSEDEEIMEVDSPEDERTTEVDSSEDEQTTEVDSSEDEVTTEVDSSEDEGTTAVDSSEDEETTEVDTSEFDSSEDEVSSARQSKLPANIHNTAVLEMPPKPDGNVHKHKITKWERVNQKWKEYEADNERFTLHDTNTACYHCVNTQYPCLFDKQGRSISKCSACGRGPCKFGGWMDHYDKYMSSPRVNTKKVDKPAKKPSRKLRISRLDSDSESDNFSEAEKDQIAIEPTDVNVMYYNNSTVTRNAMDTAEKQGWYKRKKGKGHSLEESKGLRKATYDNSARGRNRS